MFVSLFAVIFYGATLNCMFIVFKTISYALSH